jgi:hypothetical protein
MPATRKESDLMNNLWQVERLVELKQEEINREIEHARLLREAGISRGNWLTHAVHALHSLVTAKRKDPQDHASVENRSYQALSDEVTR